MLSVRLGAVGGLVVNMLARCTGGLRFDPSVENPKFTRILISKTQLDVSWMKSFTTLVPMSILGK